MLGRVVDAEQQWESMLQLGRDLQHRPSYAAALAFFLHGAGYRYSYIGQMERLAGIADELIALSKEEDFFLWYANASTYRGLISLAMGDERAGTQVEESLELFARTGTRLTLVMLNVLWAEALYRLGDNGEALQRLDVAEAEMNARQEGLLAPDIWRVRGRVLARQGERSASEAAYRQAMERAAAQHALSLELRAGLDLYELQADDGRAEEGRVLLASLLARFTQGLDRPEPARAAAIVQASS
jgi:tetratricopeptide (TPR) repeat protein